jgi:assimilatory nitrate reductase catalytic subunit
VVVAGTNIAECFPVAMQYFWGARDRGAKLVVVDPRETAMARTADEHVALRPGTDAAFYNGLLHVLVRDGLTDERFIAEHTVGFEAVRDTVPAAQVGSVTGWSAPPAGSAASCPRSSWAWCSSSASRWPSPR